MNRPFINRELSWIDFNERVLAEAENADVPLLERLKFLAIVDNNFDEFFMVRVASVKRQVINDQQTTCPTGMTPRAQLKAIHRRAAEVTARMYEVLTREILPGIAQEGLVWVHPERWDEDQRLTARAFFRERVLPVLTPVRMIPEEPLTTVRNLAIYAAFLLERVDERDPSWPGDSLPGQGSEERGDSPPVALVQVPPALDRIVYIPNGNPDHLAFTLLEQILLVEGAQLFPGYSVREQCLFRVARDADLGVDEERDEDFVAAMEQVLETRERSYPVRLSINESSDRLRRILTSALSLDKQEVYLCRDPLELSPFMHLAGTEGFDRLRNKAWRPLPSPSIEPDLPVWESVRRREVMLHFPYEQFDPVVRLIREAADDEATLAIKITLYRVSGDSPIARALETAAEKGKQVTVLVELKARFDEQTNIDVAQRLERAGAIVVHGIARLKVHAKALLVIRRESGGIERYAYLSTGNYNDRTATLYGDIGLLTAREDLTTELGLFFNAVTGYSVIPGLRTLVLAPGSLRPRLIELIRREAGRAEQEGSGYIVAKMNSLVDPVLIEELYAASQKGVRIQLNVRGICMLVPGVEDVSTGIQVVSIVDRYLEHSRIFYFDNGGAGETYLSSADWMPRNLDKRVELMFPIEDSTIQRRIREALDTYFADNVKAQELGPDHQWRRVKRKKKETAVQAQAELYRRTRERADAEEPENRQMFNVRRGNTGGENT